MERLSRQQRAQDAKVSRVTKSILRELTPLQRQVLAMARQLVAERLAPVDRVEAKHFLHAVRVRDLPS